MKLSIRKYSQILYEAVDGKDQTDIDNILANFTKLLDKNNHLKYSSRIINAFNDLCNKENGIVEMEVTSKRPLNDKVREKIRNSFKEKNNAKEIRITEKLNPEMIGGIILRTSNEIIDISMDNKLSELKKQLLA